MKKEALSRTGWPNFAVGILVGSVGFGMAQEAEAGWKFRKSSPTKIQVIPHLEVQLLSKEFETWGKEIVIYQPGVLKFRWGKPVSSNLFTCKVYRGSVAPANWVANRTLTASPAPESMHVFSLNLKGILPLFPAEQPTTYYMQVHPAGADLVPTAPVTIIYKRDPQQLTFSFQGLYPEFFQPMPIRINLHTFRIVKADEEDDEEPYLIPIIAYLDGSTINVSSLSTSSVRIQTSQRPNVHSNIPQTNALGSGVDVSIPKDVGYFEQSILPININMVETLKPFCDPDTDDDGCLIRLRDSTDATPVWIIALALEEDANDDAVANVSRDAIVQGIQEQFNQCVQGMTLADIFRMMDGGLNLQDVITSHDETITFCDRTPNADDTILDQIRNSLTDMAASAAKEEIFFNAWTFLHGGGLMHFDDVVDPDDFIGFAWTAVTYDQIMRASGAIPFTLDFYNPDNGPANEAGVHPVHYEVIGAIGRCQTQPGKECFPSTTPLLPQFP